MMERAGYFPLGLGSHPINLQDAENRLPNEIIRGQFVFPDPLFGLVVILTCCIFPVARGFGQAEDRVQRVHGGRDEEIVERPDPLCLHRSSVDAPACELFIFFIQLCLKPLAIFLIEIELVEWFYNGVCLVDELCNRCQELFEITAFG